MSEDENIVYYFLNNYNLQELEIESVVTDRQGDGRKEITFKRVGTDEGGNRATSKWCRSRGVI